MTDPKIILTRGIQGSGKTTWAKATAQRAGYVRVNRDDIRLQMFGELHGGNIDEDLVTKVETQMVLASLKEGRTVIVDATHLYQRYVNRWQRLGYPVEIQEFPLDLDSLLKLNDHRPNPVPEKVIKRNFSRFTTDVRGFLKPVTLNPEWYVTSNFPKVYQDLTLPSAFIFDIDGTLAHMDGKRSPYDYTKVDGDRVDTSVRDVLLSVQEAHDVIVVSGRKAECYDATITWLADNFIFPDALHMRADGDDRPDSIVKYEILRDEILPDHYVSGVFDDRNSVVNMWRNVGLKCFQVAEGDF